MDLIYNHFNKQKFLISVSGLWNRLQLTLMLD